MAKGTEGKEEADIVLGYLCFRYLSICYAPE
jgi:hypothetical protein